IRVLDLAPGAGDDPIRCSLSQQPLKGPESYEAVSYVWGDANRPHNIICNWRVPMIYDNDYALMAPNKVTDNFKVTDNLHKLLRHLRSPDESRRLWIDQICINQDDEAEKGGQIRMMAEIYAGASRVVIWLALDPRPVDIEEICHDMVHFDSFRHLNHFLENTPWFRRAWTFQESVMGREAIVVYEDWTRSWDVL
ncbi:HET-domain-containing protein, partial [Parathielavia hyrcaniae]